jgi:hypothetical protein
MSLVPVNVRRAREANCRGINYSTTTVFAVDDSVIKLAVPSICKREGVSDGLVNSMVTISIDGHITYLWCTDTVTTIYGLS